ncbi:unnamed protein product [Schistosoma intercalatum]|nr:unnamed protein product [Schistosoma intercalatum]
MISLSQRKDLLSTFVRPLASFNESDVTCRAEKNNFDICKVLKLLTDPHTDFMYERHKIALRNLRTANSLGVNIHDLVHYQNILKVCAERVLHLPDVYHQIFLELIQLCGKSFLKIFSSDEMNYFNVAVNFINHFGYLLQLKNVEICTSVCYSLEQFYFKGSQLKDIPEERQVQPTTKTFNQKAVCHSDIIESLLKCYCEIDQSDVLCLTILIIMDKLTKHSEVCSNKIILKLGAQFICNRLVLPIISNEFLSRSISILWNLIENTTNDTMKIEWMKQTGSEECLLKLRDMFFTLLAQSHSKLCRHLRNDILTIILLVVKHANTYDLLKQIRLIESGLIRRLVQLLTFDEFKCMNPLYKNLKLLPNDENFDMKRLILSILIEICHDPAAIYNMSTSGLIKGLFQWICPVIPTNPQQQQHEQIKSDLNANQAELANVNQSNNLKSSYLPLKNCSSYSSDIKDQITNDDNYSNLKQTLPVEKICEHSDQDIQRSDLYNDEENMNRNDHSQCKQEIDLIRKWPQAYLEELHLYMLDSLAILAPYLLDDCLNYGIPSRLLILLQWCISPEPFLGQGNSFHGIGGRNSKRAQLRYSLRLIRSLVETNDERIITDFVCQGLIQFLIPLICPISSRVKLERSHDELFKFGNLLFTEKHSVKENNSQTIYSDYQQYLKQTKEIMEEDNVGLEMQCDILLILSKLCGTVPERKQMIGIDGTHSIIKLLKQLIKRFTLIKSNQYRLLIQLNEKPLTNHQFIILHNKPLIQLTNALIESIWCCIIGSNLCEDYFLMNNGAIYLLNLLEWYPLESINYLLGCLVDLTENPKCLPYLSCWSGIRSLNDNDDYDEENNFLLNNRNSIKQQLNHLELTTSLLMKSPDPVVSTRLHKIILNTNKHTTDHHHSNNIHSNQVHLNMANEKGVDSNEIFNQDSINPCEIEEVNNNDDDNDDDDKEESINIWLNGPSLAQLLCYIWRWEEKRLIKQKQFGTDNVKDLSETSATKQNTSLQMNIYALFLRLGFNNQENLTFKDQITLKKIESYFDLKMAETWTTIQTDLDNKQIRPITPDNELLSCISEWCKKQINNVQCKQQEILDATKTYESTEEQKYYSSIRKIIRNQEYAMENYNDYIARTSNHQYLKEARIKQLSAINASRIGRLNDFNKSSDINVDIQKNKSESNQIKSQLSKCSNHDKGSSIYHKTDIDKLNVTAFCSQTINIDSTPKQLFQHPSKLVDELIKLVESNEQLLFNDSDISDHEMKD